MNFLSLLARLGKIEAELQELRRRTYPIQIATVTAVQPRDRTIKVSREAQAGIAQSPWIPAGRSNRHSDEPLPLPGTTVVVGLIEGNPHDMVLLRTMPNDTNPPDEGQNTPENDDTTQIDGDRKTIVLGSSTHGVGGDEKREVDGAIDILCNGPSYHVSAAYGFVDIEARGAVTLRNDSGANITLSPVGTVTISDAYGHTITLGGGGTGGAVQWDLNGTAIEMLNATGFTINGKEVVVVGSTDSDGDVNNTRGY